MSFIATKGIVCLDLYLAKDAGAASGFVNVAHLLGGSLGLSILVVVFVAAGSGTSDAKELLAQRVAAAFTAGTVMLALVVVFAFILRHRVENQKRLTDASRVNGRN